MRQLIGTATHWNKKCKFYYNGSGEQQTIEYPDGKVEAGEVGLPITRDNLVLPCGIYGRWEKND